MQPKYTVALRELPHENPQYHWINEKMEVMVFRDRGRLRVFSSICPHMGAQMEYRSKQQTLFCPWHGLTLNLKNNRTNHTCYHRIKEHRAEIRGQELFLYD